MGVYRLFTFKAIENLHHAFKQHTCAMDGWPRDICGCLSKSLSQACVLALNLYSSLFYSFLTIV